MQNQEKNLRRVILYSANVKLSNVFFCVKADGGSAYNMGFAETQMRVNGVKRFYGSYLKSKTPTFYQIKLRPQCDCYFTAPGR